MHSSTRNLIILVLALVAGGSFYFNHWLKLTGPEMIVWKGLGVALLAVWAAMRARSTDGWLIAAVLGLGALGDVLLETNGLTVGALAFLAGHIVAVILYLRNARGSRWLGVPVALLVAFIAWSLPDDRAAAPGIALYALGLGAMAGTAYFSRFPRGIVGAGALLFVASDLLIFARLGPMHDSVLPGLLIWPTYFTGQALIAWGVVTALARR